MLHIFAGPPSDGQYPLAPLVRDSAGNIYGTTALGGSDGDGTVFKIDTAGNETLLHSFTGFSGGDGCGPAQGLVIDKSGNLFGTTGGCGASSSGTIFEIDSSGNETILHSFGGGDGANPQYGHLIMDNAGNLYGVTSMGGAVGLGVVYEFNIATGTFTLLHSFAGGTDGCYPYGSVVQDKAGNLYGTTLLCGSSLAGTIWKVSTTGKETILHNFSHGPSNGCIPYGGVAVDAKGNLYGVTSGCGANNWGALYELSTTGKFSLLHSFDYWKDGADPMGEVLLTTSGKLFGTTYQGDTHESNCFAGLTQSGCGTVWSYKP